ncbi:site-specific integrase [Paracoccus aeridis]|uniref:site-specific integrase n=1 Tax=Paracoccus aeridis TaxID=1966466 RepID=UPI0013756A1A|nr:site-specific integrase [Paracoccus aeridis]
MPRPARRRPGSPFYFRARVPADVQHLVGKSEVSFSLRTSDEAEAQKLHAQHLARHYAQWEALRNGPQPLTGKQVAGLCGEWYSGFVGDLSEEPGELSVWDAVREMLDRTRSDDRADLERHYGSIADDLLSRHGLAPDDYSRGRLLSGLRRTMEQAAETLSRRATGDYGPDTHAGSFPALQPPEIGLLGPKEPTKQGQERGGASLWDLFNGWEKEHRRNGKAERTITDFRGKVRKLVEFVEHDDAAALTAADIVRWKDHLLDTGIGARTVSDKYLVAVRGLFNHAKANAMGLADPTENVSVSYSAPQATRERGFTEAEAKTILAAARAEKGLTARHAEHTRRAIRWVPWICAFTGARVTEITQLRKGDVETVSGVPCIRITPDAGSVKTRRYRRVPLHPQLVREGFLEFVEGCSEGPLFRSPTVDAENVSKRVGAWVREVVGISDDRLQPNHGWRHRFKTLCRNHGVPGEWADHLQGHANTSAAAGYGEYTVPAMLREVKKLPDCQV